MKIILLRHYIIKIQNSNCRSPLQVLLNVVLVVKDLQESGGVVSGTLVLSASLQILYACDLLWFEVSCGHGVLAGREYLTFAAFGWDYCIVFWKGETLL